MSARGLAALFVVGAAGGLIGDMCHVQSGTTVYLEDPLPYVSESQLWFPLMVGGGTAAVLTGNRPLLGRRGADLRPLRPRPRRLDLRRAGNGLRRRRRDRPQRGGRLRYADDVEQILGVAAWLPALYLAYGVVASRLGVLVSPTTPS